jgi:N-acetylglucosaminyldiphosphoundecaprenol N-acetyl-beta-D-mannosaminyltransferase
MDAHDGCYKKEWGSMMLMVIYLSIFYVVFAACMTPLTVKAMQSIDAVDFSLPTAKLESLVILVGSILGLLIIRLESPFQIAIIIGAFLMIVFNPFDDVFNLTSKLRLFSERAVMPIPGKTEAIGSKFEAYAESVEGLPDYSNDHLESQKHDMVEISHLPFVNSTMQQFLQEKIKPSLGLDKKTFIITANPEIVMATRRDSAYKKVVLKADYIVPDGIGIIFAAKFKRKPMEERIAGIDLMKGMLSLANKQHAACYFLGASADSNHTAVGKIKESYPNIQIAGHHHGYFNMNDKTFAVRMAKTEPDFIFVALGYPRQEMWIKQHMPVFSKGIFMGVGGCLDVFSGNVKRAPDLFIKCNLEWLYRLIKQPFRLKRMLPIVGYIWLLLRKKL